MRFRSFVWCVLLAIAPSATFGDAPDAAIENAVRFERAFPDVPDDTDAASAYAIQARVVATVFGTKIAGYKAGLTSVAAQQRFGVDRPVLGVLPESGRLGSGAALALVPGLKIEVEIGFIVGIDDAPASMLAVIELPRLAYVDMKNVTFADIVATNVSAYRFIAGPSAPVDRDVRKLAVSLDRDGAQLFSSYAADTLGDPLTSYDWMLSRIHALGYRLEPGMVMITGSLGRVVDAEPASYVAHYGSLGELKFKIDGETHAIQTTR